MNKKTSVKDPGFLKMNKKTSVKDPCQRPEYKAGGGIKQMERKTIKQMEGKTLLIFRCK